jgi:hypothetical protein
MSLRARMVIVVMWIGSLVAVAGLATAQARLVNRLPSPIVLSGPDLGFRVTGYLALALA